MDLRHLRLFLKVLEHGSITTAANELGMNQPALSKHISRLEDELSTNLLDRLPRGVAPNVYGKILGHYARSIDANYRSALRHIDAVRNASAGKITIGAGSSWREGLLPVAIANLFKNRPNARVNIIAGVPDTLLTLLLRGEIDMALAPVNVEERFADSVVCEPLIKNHLVVVASRGHPMADGRARTLADLSELRWVMPPGTSARRRFEQLFELHGIVTPEPSVESDDVPFLLEIVANSELVTLVSVLRMHGERRESLTVIPCPEAETSRETGIILPETGTLPPLGHELIDELRIVSKIAMS